MRYIIYTYIIWRAIVVLGIFRGFLEYIKIKKGMLKTLEKVNI